MPRPAGMELEATAGGTPHVCCWMDVRGDVVGSPLRGTFTFAFGGCWWFHLRSSWMVDDGEPRTRTAAVFIHLHSGSLSTMTRLVQR